MNKINVVTVFYISEYVKANKSTKSIKEKFKQKFGIAFDRFMLLDLTDNGRCVNPSKYASATSEETKKIIKNRNRRRKRVWQPRTRMHCTPSACL